VSAATEVVHHTAGWVERLTSPAHVSPGDELSRREHAVLRLLASGLSPLEIGDELHLSLNMVKSHISGIVVKLGATSSLDAVNRARDAGLIAPGP